MLLFLMRHASAEPGEDKRDFGRHLTNQGEVEAENAAEQLQQAGYILQKITCSPAVRSKRTTIPFIERFPAAKLNFLMGLYERDLENISARIAAYSRNKKNHLIIGHNPLIYDLACKLCFNGQEALLQAGMPPAQIIVIEPEVKPAEIEYKLKEIIPPISS